MGKNKKNKKFSLKWCLYIIQVIVSIVALLVVYKLNVLPNKFFVLVGLILLVWNLITFVLANVSRKKGNHKYRFREILSMVLCFLMSVLLVLGSTYAFKTSSLFSSLTGADVQVHSYAVFVLKDSKAEKISDLQGKMIALNSSVDKKKTDEALSSLKKSVDDVSLVKVNNFEKLADQLYDKSVDGILVSQAYIALLEGKHPDFLGETKIIWTYEIEEKVANISKDVDVTKEAFSVFLSGIDTQGPVSTVSRSDVNMVVTINPNTRKILMTSIPRDYYVTLADLGQKDKLTHAGLTGIENSVKTIENFLDININYYGKVNFTTIIQIVDALGGVTVYSPYTFSTLSGDFYQGENYVNGEKALAFVRERYNLPNGDNDRIHNQQLLLQGMIEKAISPAIIYNYTSVLDAIEGCFETNMASKDITNIIKMQLEQGGGWTIIQQQLTGTGTMMTGGAYMPNNNLYYTIPNQDSINECSAAIKSVISEK